MSKSAKAGDTVTTPGCSTGYSSTNQNQKSHVWRFKDGSAQYSQILSRTDAEYTAFIAGIDSSAANGYFGGWKSGAGTETNWQEFGIPVVSQTLSSTPGTAQCSDGRDNDNDGLIDYPQDTSCYGTTDNDEYYPLSSQTATSTTATSTTTIIPAAPGGLTAVQSGNNVLLSWDDNAVNEYEYKIEWHNLTDWISFGSTSALYGGRGSYTDYSPSARTHQYRVKACNAVGCSESNTASITVTGTAGGTCPSGFHVMTPSAGGVGYCMSDASPTICQPLGGGAAHTCPSGHTATTTPGVVPALTSIFPTSGPIGTRVTITGSGFTPAANQVNFDTGVIVDLASSNDGKTIAFTVPDDRVPFCAIFEPRCLLPAPYNPVKPGTYWISVRNNNGNTGALSFSVTERVAAAFSVEPSGTAPASGAAGVDPGTRIKVKLTREIDPSSTAKEFFRLTKSSAPDARVSGSFAIFSDGFEFIPEGLEAGTNYTYTVLPALRDRAGMALSASYGASFTTGASSRGSAVVSGKASDAAGTGIPKAWINIFSSPTYYASNSTPNPSAYNPYPNYFSRSIETDASGAFQISVPAGSYMITTYPPSDRIDLTRTSPQEITVAGGQTKTVNFTFSGAVKIITGTVAFSNGTPVSDAEVGAYASETRQWTSAPTDATGGYTLKVSGGSWLVGIHPRDSSRAKWSWDEKPKSAAFAKDQTSETKTVNFTIPLRDAALAVLAADEGGTPLSSVGVIADTHSSASQSSEFAPPSFRITGSDGKASFSLRAGTYYLRAYVPADRGYFNPQEQTIVITAGETKDVALTFKKRQTVRSLTVSGITKIEGGILVDAFIWAWSERGGSSSVRADKSGKFSFTVTPNERWHIGAGKEYKDFPYKSPELVVEVKSEPVTIELLLTKQSLAPLPPTVSITQAAAQQVVAQATDGAQITVPPGGAGSSGNVQIEIKPTVEAPSQAGTDVVSTIYDVSIRDTAGNAVTALTHEAEIVIPYDEAELKEQGVSEDAITGSFFDEKTGSWVGIEECTTDKTRNVMVCRVNHLTKFAITARTDTTPPAAPASPAASATGAGKITITWKNPAKDFDYAKVYRSPKAGELGTVRAAQVRASQFADSEGITNGAAYYYTVRAVDPAGNESVNTEQIKITASGTSGAASAPPAVPSGSAAISRTLRRGMRGDDVKAMQRILISAGFLTSLSDTGTFGPATHKAVIKFQEAYASELLTPVGLTKGSGIAGPGTRKKLNAMLGR
mgnify:FL=1